MTLEVASNQRGTIDEIEVDKGSTTEGWGNSPFGNTQWGDLAPAVQTLPFRENVPVLHQVGELLTIGWKHNVASEKFGITGASIIYCSGSEITTADRTG